MNGDRITQPENIASSLKKRAASPDFAAGRLPEKHGNKDTVFYLNYKKRLEDFMVVYNYTSGLYEEVKNKLSKEQIKDRIGVTDKDFRKIIKASNEAISKFRYSSE